MKNYIKTCIQIKITNIVLQKLYTCNDNFNKKNTNDASKTKKKIVRIGISQKIISNHLSTYFQ